MKNPLGADSTSSTGMPFSCGLLTTLYFLIIRIPSGTDKKDWTSKNTNSKKRLKSTATCSTAVS
jgi:hypothetical protein